MHAMVQQTETQNLMTAALWDQDPFAALDALEDTSVLSECMPWRVLCLVLHGQVKRHSREVYKLTLELTGIHAEIVGNRCQLT